MITTSRTTTTTVWIESDDTEPYTIHTEDEMEELYDEMLDDSYGTVSIAGTEYDTSTTLKRVDPVAYKLGFNEYCDASYVELEMPMDLVYGDDSDAKNAWIAERI